jgi:hypothetical protein
MAGTPDTSLVGCGVCVRDDGAALALATGPVGGTPPLGSDRAPAAPATVPARASPIATPTDTKTLTLATGTPISNRVPQPWQRRAPGASGRPQFGQLKIVPSISPIGSGAGATGALRLLFPRTTLTAIDPLVLRLPMTRRNPGLRSDQHGCAVASS